MEIKDKITPIIIDDFELFKVFFNNDKCKISYGNSWIYITQACRGLGLGYKYYDKDILVPIGKYKEHYVVVRPLGLLDNRFYRLLEYLKYTAPKRQDN